MSAVEHTTDLSLRPQLGPDATLADVIAELHRRDLEQIELETAVEALTRSPGCILDQYDDVVFYRRPERRWRQFGSRGSLLETARRLGAKNVMPRDSREYLIKALWRVPGIRAVMPGSLGYWGPIGGSRDEDVAS